MRPSDDFHSNLVPSVALNIKGIFRLIPKNTSEKPKDKSWGEYSLPLLIFFYIVTMDDTYKHALFSHHFLVVYKMMIQY